MTVKWRNEAVGAAEYKELERISIVAYPSVRERRYYMLSRSGFMNNLKEFAARSDGMITLIDGGALLDD